ncbi:formimidoylglutamate deiminase [Nocardioides sp. SYSU DS0651]|uniref:formimidoylglutamate deiminase n=1 Tax=Nocardioides sp. SYSU DS0651 TaxID=3415955 RepID=UPI003F4C926A
MTTAYLLERAWVGGVVRDAVRVEVADGRFTAVEPDAHRPGVPVRGLTLPGLANTHSHAFHRALRGRTQRERGTFWTWREQMYAAASRLDPETYYALARAAYGEMVAAGFTSVGEFHYVHHQPDGRPYADPTVMSQALLAAARDAGIRICLLDTCYLAGGYGEPLTAPQRRFGDADADAWAARASARVAAGPGAVLGAAVHSVRAVPREALGVVAGWSAAHAAPLHVHLSEQVAENEGCLASYGMTPTALLADAGVLGPAATAVHATHLSGDDVALLAASGTAVSLCPTTERDLGDGIGPARRLADAGVRLAIGSDSHAVVDPFEEMRAVEADERLASQQRGRFAAAELLAAGTAHACLGFDDAGEIAVGRRADLVTIDTCTPRTAGTGADEHTAVFAATAADVRLVVVDGRVVFDGDHERVGRDLDAAVGRLWA